MTMIAVSASGYFIVGVLFALLAVLLVTSWRGHRLGIYLIIACLVNAVWGFLLAWNLAQSPIEPLLIFFLEVARTSSWVFFLVHIAGQMGISRNVRIAAGALCGLVLLGGFGTWAGFTWFRGSGDIGQVLFPGGLAIALTGLLLIEQLYRNATPETRWGLKAVVLGLGGICAYDLFLYSQAVLFNAIDTYTWAARGVVNVLFVPAIAIAARRNPDWELRIFVSRQVVFYTTTLVAVGGYLLLMSLGGFLLLRIGGSWGALARIVFFTGAILVLLILLFSSTLRLQLRVFLSKHFFQNRYDYREEWMRLIDTLAEFEESSTREVAVKAVAQLVDSPAGVLWIYSRSESKFLLDARYDYEQQEVCDISADDPLVTFMRKDNWIVDLAELARDPELYKDLELPEWVQLLSSPWLFVPLMFGQELLGLIMLTKAPGLPKLNYEDRDLLKTAGNHVAVHLAQARSDRLLTEAQQFETYNKLTAFLMHDLNNLLAQQSLIVKNAEKHKRNPEFVDDAIDTISNSVERMTKVMEQLKRGEADRSKAYVAMSKVVTDAIGRCATHNPVATVEMTDDLQVSANAEEFTMVLSHLIRNAQDATPASGSVTVKVEKRAGNAYIRVVDDGAGMSPEFIRDRLFRPFDSTKGVEGMGIGAYQAREFARNLGGDLRVQSAPDEGTTVIITMPLG
jgi:putative PEP-CTERM system histidine kinase